MEANDEPSSRPLVVTTDEAMLDDLLRFAAAAGTVPEVASDVPAARRAWSGAGVVVVGSDSAAAIGEARMPRRDAVLLVSDRPADARTWKHAVAMGAAEVLTLPEAQAHLIDLFGDCVEAGAGGGTTVSVIGSCGGSGASTFACALSLTSANLGRPTLIVDADPLGGGVDLILGAEHEPGVRWPDLAETSGRLSAPSLRNALPRSGELSILSHDRAKPATATVAAMRSVLGAGQRGHDLVVVDLPRCLDACAEEAVVRSSVTLVVVPAEVRAVAAASRVLAALRDLAPRLGLVVRGPGPSGLRGEQLEDSLGVPAWVTMRPDRGLGAAVDEGLGPLRRRRGPLASGCRAVLDQLPARTAAA